MIKSMTAFGRCSGIEGGKNITVEIKSVNNRFLDCSVKLPRAYSYIEDRIKPYLQSRGIFRGKIDVNISITTENGSDAKIDLDENYLNEYLKVLARLRDEYKLKDDITVMNVASNREIFTFHQPESDEEQDWNDINKILSKATDIFCEMRENEGRNILSDLTGKKTHLEILTGEIEKEEPNMVSAYLERLETKLKNVLEQKGYNEIDETKIITECALFADKVAVDEETVRLRSHFSALDKAFASDEPVGRRIDFLLQEIGREINTIGSKVSDIRMTEIVVEMKSELERIREQIQNIE